MILDHVRNREELVQLVAEGTVVRYFFFWGHRPLASGEIGKSCLSQWWQSAFSIGGVRYATAEHFMMAEKARLFRDEGSRANIIAGESPKAAKELGRDVKDFDEEIWQKHRLALVIEGNHATFSQNLELAKFLLGTGHDVLVEASPVIASGESAWPRVMTGPRIRRSGAG